MLVIVLWLVEGYRVEKKKVEGASGGGTAGQSWVNFFSHVKFFLLVDFIFKGFGTGVGDLWIGTARQRGPSHLALEVFNVEGWL